MKEENKIVVGEKKDLEEEIINIKDFNWLGPACCSRKRILENLSIKVRARQKPTLGHLEFLDNDKARVILEHKISGVAKGQGCVIYDKNQQMLGGGWIT